MGVCGERLGEGALTGGGRLGMFRILAAGKTRAQSRSRAWYSFERRAEAVC